MAQLFLKNLKHDKFALFGVVVLVCFVFISIFAPVLAPYDPKEIVRDQAGEIKRLHPPSSENWFGTTNLGRDVLSQVIIGSRTALLVGLLAALFVTVIGTAIGIVSGYFGGWVDTLCMRIVDIVYAIPFVPFVIVLVSLLEPSIWNVILAVSLLTWRSVARVIRAQVLSIVKRPFLKAAKITGASHARIMFKYILPSVVPLALLEMAFMVNWAITAEASVAFLGFGDPDIISWGQILQLNFLSGASAEAWWWSIPPGVAIVLVLVAVFFVARALEDVVNPRLRGR